MIDPDHPASAHPAAAGAMPPSAAGDADMPRGTPAEDRQARERRSREMLRRHHALIQALHPDQPAVSRIVQAREQAKAFSVDLDRAFMAAGSLGPVQPARFAAAIEQGHALHAAVADLRTSRAPASFEAFERQLALARSALDRAMPRPQAEAGTMADRGTAAPGRFEPLARRLRGLGRRLFGDAPGGTGTAPGEAPPER